MSEELTITEFIRAKLDRLEALATDAANSTAMNWESDEKYPVDVTYTVDAITRRFGYVFYAEGQAEAANLHAAANDPAHVLAWVAAIRAVVEMHRPNGRNILGYSVCDACTPLKPVPCPTIRAIAGIWAGQDGWQEAWK